MRGTNKLLAIFKSPTRLTEEVTGIRSLWSYMYRDVLKQRQIGYDQHTAYINAAMRQDGLVGKALSTERSNVGKQLSGNKITWAAYVKMLSTYGCTETTYAITHKWGTNPDGTEIVTFHQRTIKLLPRGLIVIDEVDDEEDEEEDSEE